MASRRPPVKKTTAALYEVMVVGASWGGINALSALVSALPSNWHIPIVIVQHQRADSKKFLENILARLTPLTVVDVEEKDVLEARHIYIAPANYHLLIEQDRSFSLSVEAPVNFSRPSIDVTFSSIAAVFHSRCIGLVLTGANEDGAAGVRAINMHGGYVLVQSPESAEAAVMPQAAIDTGVANAVENLSDIVPHLIKLLATGTR